VENIAQLIRRTTQSSSPGLAHFVAVDSANGRTADGSEGAADCNEGTAQHAPLAAPT